VGSTKKGLGSQETNLTRGKDAMRHLRFGTILWRIRPTQPSKQFVAANLLAVRHVRTEPRPNSVAAAKGRPRLDEVFRSSNSIRDRYVTLDANVDDCFSGIPDATVTRRLFESGRVATLFHRRPHHVQRGIALLHATGLTRLPR